MKKIVTLYSFLSLIFFILLLQCAHRIPPTGGPEDTTPPKVLKVSPPSGTLNHPLNKKISFTFSEWIEPRNAKKSVTLFPPPPGGFSIEVNGRTCAITPKEAFVDSTTYHICFSSGLTDYRTVGLQGSYNYFFSTGASIDSGMITGCIIASKESKQQPKVALYRIDGDTLLDSTLLFLPSYLVQTDSLGIFTFKHIRKGSYCLVALQDKDNNNRITPGEALFLPQTKTFILNREAGPFLLFPSTSDTLSNRIDSVRAISPKLITCAWKQDFVDYENNELSQWSVISLDSTAKDPEIEALMEVRNSTICALKLKDTLTTGSYALIRNISHRYSLPPKQSKKDSTIKIGAKVADTIRFNGTTETDTILPKITGTKPGNNAPVNTPITISWSEPVRSLSSSCIATDTTGDTVHLHIDTVYSMVTTLVPQKNFRPGKEYNCTLPFELFVDMTNNQPAPILKPLKNDSTQMDTTKSVTITFTILPLKKICMSISGGANCLEPNNNRIWQFKPLRTKDSYVSFDSAGHFRFDSIPAFKGTIAYFVDSSKIDSSYTPGRLFPWLKPEPFYSFEEDTIEARANWDIEGISVPACTPFIESRSKLPPKANADTTTANPSE